MDRIYRGKSAEDGKWIVGYYNGTDGCECDFPFIRPLNGTHRPFSWRVDPDTVGQFIGLDDKNEKPIFEDDIVKQTVQYPDSEPKVLIGVVKEDFCNPCFVIDDGKFPEFDFIKCGYATLEVLGNVHDNPELIGGIEMKYRKKPVVIDAIQFTRDNVNEVFAFTDGNAHDFMIERKPNGKCVCIVHTLEGNTIATEGDYIIRGVHGEYYPCKPDIFEETYEVAE